MPVSFEFLDVGMGDGTFIIGPGGEHILVDFGSTKSRRVAPVDAITYMKGELEKRDPPTLDLLVLTHPDQDHYNQIKNLFAEVDDLRVDRVLYGGNAADYGVGGFYDDFLKGWVMDGTAKSPANSLSQQISGDPFFSTGPANKKLKAWILGANYATKDSPANLLSVVLLFEFKGIKVVLTGDATIFTEKFILGKYKDSVDDLRSDLMKVPHHGSDTSSSEAWVDAVHAEVITISADSNPSYGLPRCGVIGRYLTYLGIPPRNVGCVCFDTDTDMFDARSIRKNLLCSLTEPHQGVQWEFQIKDDGSWSISST